MLHYTNGAILLDKREVQRLVTFVVQVQEMHIHEGDDLHAEAAQLKEILTGQPEKLPIPTKLYGSD